MDVHPQVVLQRVKNCSLMGGVGTVRIFFRAVFHVYRIYKRNYSAFDLTRALKTKNRQNGVDDFEVIKVYRGIWNEQTGAANQLNHEEPI